MGSVSSFSPGRFCWIELATTDQPAAKAFYGSLFGWRADDQAIGPDTYYTMLKHEGRDAGALYGLSAEQKRQGVPATWLVYISVASADAAAAKAQGLGAATISAPFDVMDVGRMAILKDPTGATFAVWQARRHQGLGVMDEPGAFCWGELTTRDPKRAASFYTALFGWGAKPDKKEEYTEWTLGGKSIGGMMAIGAEWGEMPSHWSVYFQVSDCDKTTEKAQGLGAQVHVPPRDIPGVGRFAVIADPQGASFSIVKLTGPGH
jgi:predicted enzyme related to lactoylglutathione lyase